MKSYSALLIIGILLLFASFAHATYFNNAQQCQGAQDEITSTCAWGDYDNDGDQELFVGTRNSAVCHLWQKDGTLFNDDDTPAVQNYFEEGLKISASCWGDFNNDGNLDLFIADDGGFTGSYLFQNQGPNIDGDYTFLPYTGLSFNDAQNKAKGAVWGDFNNDGFLDLCVVYSEYGGYQSPHFSIYQGSEYGMSEALYPFDSDPAITPIDVVAGDLDNDGDLDLFIVGAGQCWLYRNLFDRQNPGVITFTDQATASIVNLTDGTSASFADFNYDGKLDLFITGNNPVVGSHLFRNDGSDVNHINFTNVTEDEFPNSPNQRPMAGNGAAWGDFDLDGDLDLYIIGDQSDTLYQNGHRENLGYFITIDRPTSGLGDAAQSFCTEWADYDNNGKPDIFMGNLITQNTDEFKDKLYRNVFPNPDNNKYLSVRLIGSHCGRDTIEVPPSPQTYESNQSAIGAKVKLIYKNSGISIFQIGEVSGAVPALIHRAVYRLSLV